MNPTEPTPKQYDLLHSMIDMFRVCKPDDDDEAFEEANEQAEALETRILADEQSDALLYDLYQFNSEWFPDGLDKEDQDEYDVLLDHVSDHLDASGYTPQ